MLRGKKAVEGSLACKLALVLMLLLPFSVYAKDDEYHKLNWDNLLLSALKLDFNVSYPLYAKSYLQMYDPKTWQLYGENEFERDMLLSQASDSLMWKVADFKHDTAYAITVKVAFGSYDFAKKAFFFKPFKESTFLGDKREQSYEFPKEFRVYFSNWDKFDGIAMNEEEAKALLAVLRDKQTGQIPRLLDAQVIFHIDSLRSEVIDPKMTALNAKILKIRLATDPEITKIVQEVLPTE
jgi:hypothetical protein